MGRIYENPPLIEALCEFQFESNQPWDWTIPGLVYDKIKSDFPKKRQQNMLEVEMTAEEKTIAQRVKGGVARMQFLREDENVLVQVGPDLLVVNHLKPYYNWINFKRYTFDVLEIYQKIVNPKGIRRVVLRYINRVEIPERHFEIEDYILAVPSIPHSIPQIFRSFITRVEIPFQSDSGILVLQTGMIPLENMAAFQMDLSFISIKLELIVIDSAPAWIENAHDIIEQTFETCITDKSRAIFKEVKSNE